MKVFRSHLIQFFWCDVFLFVIDCTGWKKHCLVSNSAPRRQGGVGRRRNCRQAWQGSYCGSRLPQGHGRRAGLAGVAIADRPEQAAIVVAVFLRATAVRRVLQASWLPTLPDNAAIVVASFSGSGIYERMKKRFIISAIFSYFMSRIISI